MPSSPTSSRWRRVLPNAVGFCSSMAVMVLELVAGRLVSNNVGSSQYTWTSIIGVILAGMSLGNRIGGRLADRSRPGRLLWRLFLAAAVLIALTLPLNRVISAVKRSMLHLVIENPGGSSHLWGGSVLLMMTLVFLLPAAALGLISPVVARMALEANPSSGRAIGDVYSWGAVGAILGVFLSGFVLVSWLPVGTIVLLVAAVMVALAGLTFAAGRIDPGGPGGAAEIGGAGRIDPGADPAETRAAGRSDPVGAGPAENRVTGGIDPAMEDVQ